MQEVYDSIKLYYDLLIRLNRAGDTKNLKYVAKLLLQQICLACLISNYVPKEIEQVQLEYMITGITESDLSEYKPVLRDSTVTYGFRGISKPIDVEVVYQILFDRDYMFIPDEWKPKPDFMNPPEI